jgi:UDPglucose 6-dehydrogenase
MERTHITIVGAGYVGMSLAVLFASHHDVTVLEIDSKKLEMLRALQSPIRDQHIEEALATGLLRLSVTDDPASAYIGASYIVIATPTNYDPETEMFDTSSIESVLEDIRAYGQDAYVIIKSTVPLGYTASLHERFPELDIIFSPEFLREGKALFDNLNPSRIVIGSTSGPAIRFAEMLSGMALSDNVPIVLTGPTEAEAIKLFSNTYLAMRVTFFNELDTYAETHGLDAKAIIDGVSLDPRIGTHYNNPSFGYGGYCLPKDTKQLLSNYKDVPNNLIRAVVEGNDTRVRHIASEIMRRNPERVGIHRLAMKKESDNFRDSSVLKVIRHLLDNGLEVIIYEPGCLEATCFGCVVDNDLESFKERSSIIVSNRHDPSLSDVLHKVYTRDLYGFS